MGNIGFVTHSRKVDRYHGCGLEADLKENITRPLDHRFSFLCPICRAPLVSDKQKI